MYIDTIDKRYAPRFSKTKFTSFELISFKLFSFTYSNMLCPAIVVIVMSFELSNYMIKAH